MNCDIPLQLATTRTYLTILIPCAIVLIICTALLFSGKLDTRLRQGAVVVVALANVLFAGNYLYQFLSARVMVNDHVVIVKSGMSLLTVNLSAIRWEAATDGTAMKFPYRENGTSIGDFAIGWFRSDDGKKAYLLRSSSPTVILPTTEGFDLVLPKDAVDRLSRCRAQSN